MSTALSATIDVQAPPAAVWAVVSDLERMGEWSPQCKTMKVLGGEPKLGTRTINVNKRGPVMWPTTAKVVRFEPERRLAFRVTENHTIWSYELEPTETGTRVIERREAPGGTTAVSDFLIRLAFGGQRSFDGELERGMNATLAKIKAAAER